jgi:cobyrinic acid a,c-diamide synthase
MSGIIISAPSSGAGKTTISLGLLRALRIRGHAIRGAKSGPDYIDPRFHEAASGQPCFNLDAWAMSPARIRSLAATARAPQAEADTSLLSGHLPQENEADPSGPLIIEGAMGLFDGAPPAGKGATADLARMLGLPVVLIIDCARMAQSVAPLAAGFAGHDPSINLAGVILNNVGSERHQHMLRDALAAVDLTVFGSVPRQAALSQPSRHLGLVQASEHPDLDGYLHRAAGLVEEHIDVDALVQLITASVPISPMPFAQMSPPAQRIALASDAAFAFAYPHLLADWYAQGAEIFPFSPLADEPAPAADLIVLPGGYPELHAGRLSNNQKFIQSLRIASQTTDIYGECGGYMTLGETLTDADGHRHPMAGLLPLQTSFQTRKLHLGYRHMSATRGPFTGAFNAHEFHYATTSKAAGQPLFQATDATGTQLPDMGLIAGRVSGSFAHIIDMALP